MKEKIQLKGRAMFEIKQRFYAYLNKLDPDRWQIKHGFLLDNKDSTSVVDGVIVGEPKISNLEHVLSSESSSITDDELKELSKTYYFDFRLMNVNGLTNGYCYSEKVGHLHGDFQTYFSSLKKKDRNLFKKLDGKIQIKENKSAVVDFEAWRKWLFRVSINYEYTKAPYDLFFLSFLEENPDLIVIYDVFVDGNYVGQNIGVKNLNTYFDIYALFDTRACSGSGIFVIIALIRELISSGLDFYDLGGIDMTYKAKLFPDNYLVEVPLINMFGSKSIEDAPKNYDPPFFIDGEIVLER